MLRSAFLLVSLLLALLIGPARAQGLVGAPTDPCFCDGSHHDRVCRVPVDPRFGADCNEVGMLEEPQYDYAVLTRRVVTAITAVITVLFCRWRIMLIHAAALQDARQGVCLLFIKKKWRNQFMLWYSIQVLIPIAVHVVGVILIGYAETSL